MKINCISKLFFLSLVFLLSVTTAMGQGKMDLAVGWGHPELLNLGVRLQVEQSQLGLSAGVMPGEYENSYSVGADYYYHFAGSTSLSTRRTWYGRLGLNYLTTKNENVKSNYLLLVPRIGKDFNLSPKWGISGDAGVSVVLSRKEEGYEFDFFGLGGWREDVELSLGVAIFYRL